MRFSDPPPFAAWAHHDAREGFEVMFSRRQRDGWQLEGSTTALEDGHGWTVSYELILDTSWHTLRARVTSQTGDGQQSVEVQQVSAGSWLVNGSPAPQFDGCQDVDLEASAMTNTLPVHRLGLELDESAAAPAVFIRALDAGTQFLEQTYHRVAGPGPGEHYAYAAPAFDVSCRLEYDESGLVLSYPGLATRQH